MIAKVTRGADGGGLVRYLMGPGRAEEHINQRVIAASDMVVVPIGAPLTHEQAGDLGRQLDAARTLYGTEVAGGHIWHLALSTPGWDRELADEEWADVVRDAMARLGFTEASGRAPCRWVAVRHGRSVGGHDHVHVAVSLVRDDGTKASVWRDRVRMSEVCADAEVRLGLSVVDGRKRGGLPGTGRPETEAAQRRGRPEPERAALARTVRAAAVASAGEAEFVRRLRASGLLVCPRYGAGGTEEVVGYSVALAPAANGGPIWYGGGRLARDLALPALRSGWEGSAERPEEALEAWRTRRGTVTKGREAQVLRSEGWRNGAVRIELALVELVAVPASDSARWAAVARELSGMFAAWSARAEKGAPGPLARVADALAWSAQYRSPGQWRDKAAVDFRGVAGVIAQAALSSEDGWALLLRQMRRTVEAVEAAHRARGELLQAARLARVVAADLAELEARAERAGAHGAAIGTGTLGRPATVAGLLRTTEEPGYSTGDKSVGASVDQGIEPGRSEADPGLGA